MTRRYRSALALAAVAAGAMGLSLAGEPPATLEPLAPPVEQQVEPAQDEPGGRAGFLQPAGGLNAPARGPARSHYRTLLKKIEIPGDRATFGDFYDWGYWGGGDYAGQNGLPAGYWVYLAPDWYIFKEDATPGSKGPIASPRPWGPEQAVGAPDTWPKAGDLGTAWASANPDGGKEWLELTYAAPSRPVAVLVYETFNPGAVDRVTGFDASGNEVELWSGSDPTAAGRDKGISIIPVQPAFDLTRVRVYLDSKKVPGWNEIDAVGLLDASGATRWAASATASSTYADRVTDQQPEVFLNRLDVQAR